MKKKLLAAFVFLCGCATLGYAQDTTMPVITQHAYDSTLKALKKQETIKHAQAKDTAKKRRIRYTPTGYLALSPGEAYPEGAFKSKGYPVKGGALSFTAAFPGKVSHFGFIFKINYGFNGFNGVHYTTYLTNSLNSPYLAYSISQHYQYTYKTLLMGLYYTRPFRKFSVDARFLCGVMMATVPGVTVNITDYGNGLNRLTMMSYNASGRAFAFDEGISVRYLLKPRLCLMLDMDNLSASPSFNIVGNGINQNLYGVNQESKTTQSTIILPFHLFTLSLGVGYTIRVKRY